MDPLLEKANVLLTPKAQRWHLSWSASGDDLWIDASVEWEFADLEFVADRLGIKDIDLEKVRDGTDDSVMERMFDGCDTCGFGDALVVHGARDRLQALLTPPG